MHVGLNLVFLTPGEQGGMETYARELIPELVAAAPHHRFTSFINREAAATDGPWREVTGSVVVPVSARNRIQWVRGEQQLLAPLARRAGIDLLHSFASTAPAWGRFVRVTTIHDLIYRSVPDAHPGVRSLGMRLLVPLAARRSHRIIAPSQATADDIVDALGVDRARVDVVREGLGHRRTTTALPESELRTWLAAGDRSILLSVSAKLAHKNLRRLLGALALIDAGERPLLVLPGYPTPHEEQLKSLAHDLALDKDVRFLGWVSSTELEGLYACAVAMIFPTLAEGFGLPVLEAMTRGVPVLSSDLPVLHELAGGNALWFDPASEAAIAAAIRALLADPGLARRLGEGGPAIAQRFSWRESAAGTLASYALALGASDAESV